MIADKAIDGHFFLDGGTVWLYYVRIQGENMIYVAKLNDDCSILQEKDEKFLLRAEKNWELKEGHVTEGPFVLAHKGKYYLSYSANDTRSIFYAIGYAVSDRPDGPFIKYKGNPILQHDGASKWCWTSQFCEIHRTGKTCFVHTTAITVKCRIIHAKYVLIVQNL